MTTAESSSSRLSLAAALGAVWGLSEVVLGIGLHACARFASGSIMTGVALMFIAAGWALTRNAKGPLIMVAITSLFKLFDAGLLGLPVRHGAVANPIFSFWMEGLAFLVLISVLKGKPGTNRFRQAVGGGLSALLAAVLFPLVKFATTIPACVFPGTTTPLSIRYAGLAAAMSLITVPLGFWAGAKILAAEESFRVKGRAVKLRPVLPSAAVLVSLLLILAVRAI